MLTAAETERPHVRAARAGESDAWDALFKRYQLSLYAYVKELVRDEQTSLDIVQETFINAARHIAGLRDDGRFGSWLFGIAHQKCVQRWRRQSRERELEERLVEASELESEDGPLDLLIRKEREAAFLALVEELPPPQRSVLLLRFLEDFSLEEIATITETGVGTVKSRLHYAKKSLRKLIEEKEHEPNTA